MQNQSNSGSVPQQPHYDFSELYEVLRDNPAQVIQALDSAMFLMSQNAFQSSVIGQSDFNQFFSIKQIRDELTKSVFNLNLA